jgi:hypothetical protein
MRSVIWPWLDGTVCGTRKLDLFGISRAGSMSTAAMQITAEQLLTMVEDGKRCELVEGELLLMMSRPVVVTGGLRRG